MYFTTITDTRRFKVIGDTMAGVLAIYDARQGLYAPVGVDLSNTDKVIFVDVPRGYFEDELEEIF